MQDEFIACKTGLTEWLVVSDVRMQICWNRRGKDRIDSVTCVSGMLAGGHGPIGTLVLHHQLVQTETSMYAR